MIVKHVPQNSRVDILHDILQQDRCHAMPCCWDALSAKMIQDAGFAFSFMSGFAVSAARIGEPDVGLISFGEMLDQGRNICNATTIPIMGDGDTGYGNAMNVRRTVKSYAQAGFASIMIEDQIAPKRCGHTKGKLVVPRSDAINRMRAAIDARDEARAQGTDILILARTDARHSHGLDEAIWRAKAFGEMGADILFVEAPQSVDEMQQITRQAGGIHMANLIEGGATPLLSTDELHAMGYKIAAYPLTLLSAAMAAMQKNLINLNKGIYPKNSGMDFDDLKRHVGFDAYYDLEKRYDDER